MTTTIRYVTGDVRDVMATMATGSVHLVVTSPPFLALRSYLPADHPDKRREIGSEATPAGFLDTMLGLTADWRRLLAPWGSIAVEIGDTYSGSGGAGGDYNTDGLRDGQNVFDGAARRTRTHNMAQGYSGGRHGNATKEPGVMPYNGGRGWPASKSLCGIPTLYTWSLAYGRNLLTGTPSPAGDWRIRNLLTWTRPNPPVGALGDKFRPGTSFVTVACTSPRRWFDLDAVRTEHVNDRPQLTNGAKNAGKTDGQGHGFTERTVHPAGAPPLDWWDANDCDDDQLAEHWQPLHRLTTQPFRGAHYATYPEALPRRLIEAMCPKWVCADCGTAVGSQRDNRNSAVPGVRIGRQGDSSGPRPAVLLAPVLEQVDGPKPDDHEGVCPCSEGVHPAAAAGSSDGVTRGLRDGAPVRDGEPPGPEPDGRRGDSSRQRDQGRQPDRESGTDDRIGSQQAHQGDDTADGRVPVLRGDAGDEWACLHCGSTARVRGLVLDPFGGSGTTAVAAARAGRDALLIDLDARNVDLARRRIGDMLRIVSEVVDGDVTTWTVEAPLPEQRHQIDGQTNLFDLMEGHV